MKTDAQIFQYVMARARSMDVSQARLADACGLGRQNVTNWKNQRYIPPENYPALAEILQTTMDDIVHAGSHTPVLYLTEDELDAMPADAREMTLSAISIIKTALKNNKKAEKSRPESAEGSRTRSYRSSASGTGNK